MICFATVALLCGCGAHSGNLDSYIAQPEDKGNIAKLELSQGESLQGEQQYRNFTFSGEFCLSEGSRAQLLFCCDGQGDGYAIELHNGAIDGSIKSGSLKSVRNIYRSLAEDGEWFSLALSVEQNNIQIAINGQTVVNYTQAELPMRIEEHQAKVLREGALALQVESGELQARNLSISGTPQPLMAATPPFDEQSNRILALQQQMFPVIDFHVHLKGGLDKELAAQLSMQYGINYGVAPNAGEGGVGRMLKDDAEVYTYYDEVRPMPFLCGVQGEGRRWTHTFSAEALSIFDYLFTDAMTIVDHKGRLSRIYRPEEVFYDGISYEQYMDHLVDQTVKILSFEPADIYANPTFLPEPLSQEYDKYWTEERVEKVLDVMVQHDIALEINARYRIPSFAVIKAAKQRGLKFTFGTNNVDADFGALEYCLDAIEECGLTVEHMWMPSMSRRAEREVVIYNKFD